MSLKQSKKDNKLSPKCYGPYKELQKIGTMSYKLELPTSSRGHPFFLVSCLKKVIGDKILVQTIFPKLDEEGKIILEPGAVTETRTRQEIKMSSSYVAASGSYIIFPSSSISGNIV